MTTTPKNRVFGGAGAGKLYTRKQVLEAFRLALGTGKVPDSVFFEVMGCKESEPSAPVLRFLHMEVAGKKFRRVEEDTK